MNTLESLQQASDDELRVMCAELCGWRIHTDKEVHQVGWLYLSPDGKPKDFLPNYPGSLDAMAEAEATIPEDRLTVYSENLMLVTDADWPTEKEFFCATARQRCIALILTKQQP